MATRRAAGDPDIDSLLASREMVLVTGSGGVGKTTVAAALGVAAAQRQPGRILVVTVDPARRLATALGLDHLGNTPTQVSPADLATTGGAGPGTGRRRSGGPRGELWLAMLDTKAGWDELITRHAPNASVRDSVLANPLYQNITGRFVNSHDYLAMERLHEFHSSGRYDLVIVDTPPSRNALSILDAPSRMIDFFGSRLLRWLTVPYRSRWFNVASRPFNQVADRILGSSFLQDIADFFVLFQTMESGFVQRAREVEALLVDPRTAFVIVTTLETAPSHEAAFLARALADRRMTLGAIIANRVLPAAFRDADTSASASALIEALDEPVAGRRRGSRTVEQRVERALRAGFPELELEPGAVASALRRLADRFEDLSLVATREEQRRRELAALAPVAASIPWLDDDVHDLAGVGAIADHLRGGHGRAEFSR